MTRVWRLLDIVLLVAATVVGCAAPQESTAAVPFTVDCPATVATWPTSPSAGGDTPPALPADRAVGRGVLILRTCPKCGARLVTESGRIYTLPPTPVPPLILRPTDTPSAPPTAVANEPLDPMYAARLSPDGRWLSQPRRGGFRLRDLTGTRVRDIADDRFGSPIWSDDGRWFVTSGNSPPALWDLDSGTSQVIHVRPPYDRWQLAAIFGPHDLLLGQWYDGESRDPDRQHETYVTVDPASGDLRHSYPIDFGDDGQNTVDGRIIVNVTSSSEAHPSTVVISDLFRGKVIARYTLPAESPARFTFWGAVRVAGDGVLLIRDFNYAGPPERADPIQLFILDLTNGERRLACTLPPRTEFVIRR